MVAEVEENILSDYIAVNNTRYPLPEDPRVSLLVFVSGKVVLTGGKSKEDLEKALNMMYPILWEFQK